MDLNIEALKTTALINKESVVAWLETLEGKNVKWKHSANSNQVIFKTDSYYYKVYAFNEVDDFNSLIRHAFAEVYRSYGIDWEIVTVQTDKCFLDIERREVLEVCTEWYDDILLNYSNTLKLVEKKLCFDDILKQIKKQYKYVSKLKLVRNCVNKPVDYAIYKDKVILLDDADWFLYMLDNYNNPISTRNIFVKVNVFDEEYTFTHWIINSQKILPLNKINEVNDKFFLFKRLDLIKRDVSLKNELQNMLISNIHLLTSNDDNSSILEELSSIYSPFKKIFYCKNNNITDIDYTIYNKVAVKQSDIKHNKSLWDDICYEYINRNLCCIYLYTSFYSTSIEDLCELLNQAKLYDIEPINGYSHTGITLYVQWNIIKDNELWKENLNFIKQHYPNVKIAVNLIFNEPFINYILFNNIDLNSFMSELEIKVLYGGCDDTQKEFLPRRSSVLKLFSFLKDRITGELCTSKSTFNEEVNSCGHYKCDCLPYYDSDKCMICDYQALGLIN